MPDVKPMLAIVLLLLDHVPPVTVSLNVIVDPIHTEVGPVIGPVGITRISAVS